MDFHDAANIFPLDEGNIDALAEDIRKNGHQVPIETLDGKILDGRRRWLACQKAGVKPTLRAVQVSDPVAYVLSLNLHRRHLSPTQLAMVGARAREMYDRQAKEKQQAGGKSAGRGRPKQVKENLPEPIPGAGQSRDKAGEAVGVSGKSIDLASRVLANATPELIAAVDADLVAVSSAARVSALPEEEQRALVDRAKERKAQGRKSKPRPNAKIEEPEKESGGDIKGMGVIRANEAVNCLIRIPKNDALRKRGFQIVTDWIKRNR